MDSACSVPLISVRRLDKHFGTYQVLFNASLDVHPGESISLIGPDGSGETTLQRAQGWLEQPSVDEAVDGGALMGKSTKGNGTRPAADAGRTVRRT